MGFIYKITNILSGKCYIGETVRPNPEMRWKQHIQKINNGGGCPALRDAINKYGIDKFIFKVLIICFDEDRYIYEKEYIKKYNSQVPNGYNILPGGQYGGSRFGLKLSEETKNKVSKSLKKFYTENPNYYETFREKHKYAMESVDLSSAIRNSDKFKIAVKDGRVGGKAHKDGKISEETKQKIREGLLKYYDNNSDSINIDKHREIMTKVKGKKIIQFNNDNIFVREYNSIREADRISGIKKSNIQQVLSGKTKTAGGYIWKYVDEKDLKT